MKNWVSKNSAPLLLAAFCIVLAAFLSLQTDSFFSVKNLVNILEANSYRMILAVGMMCVITSGAIDLSVGSILSLSAICMRSGRAVRPYCIADRRRPWRSERSACSFNTH